MFFSPSIETRVEFLALCVSGLLVSILAVVSYVPPTSRCTNTGMHTHTVCRLTLLQLCSLGRGNKNSDTAMTDEPCWWLNTPINLHTIHQWCHGSRLYPPSLCPDLLVAAVPSAWDWMYCSGFFFSPGPFNLQPKPLSGIWLNIWMCHNLFVCFPFRGLCVHSSLFQALIGVGREGTKGDEIPSLNRDDIWSPACSSMLSVAHFPRLQCVED